ncbi:MAG TPA: acyl-CoA dehydrogenase, partial [Anaerolineae bacterium]|nr:acyl-CoA dehydrogenase [Anaerolineae bacterium]
MNNNDAVNDFEQFLREVKEFVVAELLPLENRLMQDGFATILPEMREKRAMVKSRGWWLPQMSRDIGGMGLSVHDFGRLSEILAWTPIGHYAFNAQAPDAGNLEVLHQYGTPAQKAQWLQPLADGAIRSCFSMTEPNHAGSNPTIMSTTAVKEGDSWIIDGHKWFTTSAEGAAFAIVMAVTDPHNESRHRRASMIIVPTDNEGFNHVRKIKIMGEEGDDWISHSEIKYEDCRVPLDNIIGAEGDGFVIAQQRLGPGRIHHCMRFIGMAERSFDLMCRYAGKRELAPGVPLASKQTVQNWIAESRAEINASRLLVLDAARKIDTVGTKAARTDISVIKFYTANMFLRVVDRAIQVHGALGVTDDTILSF